MTPYKPDVPDTAMFNTTQASEILDIHRHTLNEYVKRGWITCVFRMGTVKKLFEGREIKRFWAARY